MLSQTGRAALLAVAITCLMVAVHDQQDVTECLSEECAWMDEQICRGIFFPEEPSAGSFIPEEPSAGRFCASCLVIVAKPVSLIVFPSLDPVPS